MSDSLLENRSTLNRRQMLQLSTAAGVLGWLIAIWGIRIFDSAVIPIGKPAWLDFSMDYRAFGYMAAISLATGILFGLAPALRLSRIDVSSAMFRHRKIPGGVPIAIGRSAPGSLFPCERLIRTDEGCLRLPGAYGELLSAPGPCLGGA